MTGCNDVRDLLMDVARGAAMETSWGAHLDSCIGCRRRLANERMLNAGLAASASQAVPPPAIKNAVLTEFRRMHRPVPVRRRFVKWVALAAAAVLLLALLVATRRTPRQPVLTVVQPPSPAPAAPLQVAPPAVAKVPKPVRRPHTPKVAPPPQAEAAEVATDFFEIPYTDPLRPEEHADVFRIQMPRANMAVFGLPVAGGRLDSRVTADVLVGEDGVMRAVRFIR